MKLLPLSLINYPPVRVSLDFLWYDAWVGAFWDRKSKTLYVCPLPCVVIKAEFAAPTQKRRKGTAVGNPEPVVLSDADRAALRDWLNAHDNDNRGRTATTPPTPLSPAEDEQPRKLTVPVFEPGWADKYEVLP